MFRQTIRSRLPDLDEDGNPIGVDAAPSAARVSRQPPPEVRPRSRFAQEKQREREAQQPLFGGEGFTGAAGERFELNFDDTPPPASMMSTIQERTVSTPTAPSQAHYTQSTGFPQVSRRPDVDANPQTGAKKVSRFKASLAKGKSPADGAPDAKPVPKGDSPRVSATPSADPLHRDIDEENARIIDGMDDAEIKEEQAQLLEMLGPEMVEFLRARNGHSTVGNRETTPPHVPASAAVAEAVPALDPSKAARVRFNEEVHYSNPPSRSPSPVQRNPRIILPSSDDPTIGNWLQDETARVDGHRESVTLEEEEGTPGDIRRRFFPQEPMSASLEWTGENKSGQDGSGRSSASTNAATAVRFDLQGRAVEQPASSGYIDHSTEAHRHAGAEQTFSLPELIQLAKSAVAGQRTLALQVVDRAASNYLGDESDSDAGKKVSATLVTSDAVNEIIGVCARGLSDKHVGVVVLSISILHSFAESGRTRLNTTAAVLSVSPSPLHWFARLLASIDASIDSPESVGLPRPSLKAILAILCNLLDTQEDFVSAEYIETPQLLENVASLFLRRPWPPSASQGLDMPDPAAAQLLATIISRSRANAEQIIERRLEQGTFRYIAVPPWAISESDGDGGMSPMGAKREEPGLAFELASGTLRILSEYANFGLGCSALSSSAPLFRAIERWVGQTGNVLVHEGFSRSWFDLLESWSLCAIDPHSTTPEHDILWAETKDWGEHCLDVLLVGPTAAAGLSAALMTVIVRALTAWLEGASRNDKAVFKHVRGRLRSEAGPALTTAVKDAAGEDGITAEGAQVLLAVKKLVTTADMQEALGEKAALLERVQVEQAQPPIAVVPEDEGWM